MTDSFPAPATHTNAKADTSVNASERALNPDALQSRASNPAAQVWVGASAGTGKTKVLTERVLRLMLPTPDGQQGSPIHKILCITFTKAAAMEMAARIMNTLKKWAVCDENLLYEDLSKLLERKANHTDIATARRLFSDVSDHHYGMKIMTIHAFCQSVLGRFPLEAGLPPSFSIIDEREDKNIRAQAVLEFINALPKEDNNPNALAFQKITSLINEDDFNDLLGNIFKEWGQFTDFVKSAEQGHKFYEKICTALSVSASITREEILHSFFARHFSDLSLMRSYIDTMRQEGSKQSVNLAAQMDALLSLEMPEHVGHIRRILEPCFCTTVGEPRKTLITNGIKKPYPAIAEWVENCATDFYALEETDNALQTAEATATLLTIAKEVGNRYFLIKTKRCVLNYDDLIFYTKNLLSLNINGKNISPWILFKLDEGIDHLLVDEAQDTNPEQWHIIKSLCDEFYNGLSAQETARSIFIVGDTKQSIYGFQRASPEAFKMAHDTIKSKSEAAQKKWDNIPMNISFRSVHTILKTVDAIYKTDEMTRGMGEHPISHQSYRGGQAGHVEIWPVFKTEQNNRNTSTAQDNSEDEDENDKGKPKKNYWLPDLNTTENQTGALKLAEYTAQKIRSMLDDPNEYLPSRARRITAGDIMILTRRRNKFVGQLLSALHKYNIPVAGSDRLNLMEHIGTKDILSAITFIVAPHDDLNLACLLKSPLINMDEECLFRLCYSRPSSLWDRVQENTADIVTQYLLTLKEAGQNANPFDFTSFLLSHPCPADPINARRAFKTRLGSEFDDIANELLNRMLQYELSHTADLHGFLKWQQQDTTDIKRQMEHSDHSVRIMTVHGAKGLQAPIVILPDTAETSAGTKGHNAAADRLLWPNKTGLPVPLWSPSRNAESKIYTHSKNLLKERDEEEYRRLLYVALTRAEDRLYIGGHVNQQKESDASWYHLIKNGIMSCHDAYTDGHGVTRLSDPQTKPPDRTDTVHEPYMHQTAIPPWLYTPASQEVVPQKRRASAHIKNSASSPSESDADSNHLQKVRGTLVHKLLEKLPALPAEKQREYGVLYIKRYGQLFNGDAQEKIISDVLTLIHDPKMHFIFHQEALAEVPVTGLTENNSVVNGIIDRLVITDTDIHIVDFKTGAPPPHVSGVPLAYRQQLKNYASILRLIYPERRVMTYLLWVEAAHLMPIEI